jgi:uncharacterized damage-inducible protein DinB
MAIRDELLQELEQEARATQRLLERVPDSRLGWKPHDKSMTLGQLALHIAAVPGNVAKMASETTREVSPDAFVRPAAQSAAELVPALEQSLAQARAVLGAMDDATMMETWTLTINGATVMAIPRVAVLRTIMLNHWYHHRGQLSVYLRQLDVPIPSIYGPSADENPFAVPAAPAVTAAGNR